MQDSASEDVDVEDVTETQVEEPVVVKSRRKLKFIDPGSVSKEIVVLSKGGETKQWSFR